MLQQTRVEQARPYFVRFLRRFPTVCELADAPLDDVLKHWEGLGYYARARNLHRAAQTIVKDRGGRFPRSAAEWQSLAGVGPYVAAAIASIVYNEPTVAIDGNVQRVISRLFRVEGDRTSALWSRDIRALADQVLDRHRPGQFNEALMELGAVMCLPRNPPCSECPLRRVCEARKFGDVEFFPPPKPRRRRPHVVVAAGVLRAGGQILIQRRPEDGLLGGLWEFPRASPLAAESLEDTCKREFRDRYRVDIDLVRPIAVVDHAYTHFTETVHAFDCRVAHAGSRSKPGGLAQTRWIEIGELRRFAFSRSNQMIIEQADCLHS